VKNFNEIAQEAKSDCTKIVIPVVARGPGHICR
jgi:hypothetical protein